MKNRQKNLLKIGKKRTHIKLKEKKQKLKEKS